MSVNVADGVVYLRGELDDQAAIAELREAAGKVDGVRGVESLLSTPRRSTRGGCLRLAGSEFDARRAARRAAHACA